MRDSIGWHPSVSSDRCRCKFEGQRWRCPNYHAIITNSAPLFGMEQLSLDRNQIRRVSHSSHVRVQTLAYLKMDQLDGTVARHITQTSPPNARESTTLIILFWISIDRLHENVSLCKFKRKGDTLTTRTRCTPDSPARTPLTRRGTRCLAISLTCGTIIE